MSYNTWSVSLVILFNRSRSLFFITSDIKMTLSVNPKRQGRLMKMSIRSKYLPWEAEHRTSNPYRNNDIKDSKSTLSWTLVYPWYLHTLRIIIQSTSSSRKKAVDMKIQIPRIFVESNSRTFQTLFPLDPRYRRRSNLRSSSIQKYFSCLWEIQTQPSFQGS